MGRFGWKAGQARIAEQAAAAMAGDIGIANPPAPYPAGDCTPAQGAYGGTHRRHRALRGSEAPRR